MKVKRRSPEQIIRKLRTAEQLLNQGQAVADACRALEVSPKTYLRWQQLYGGMKATEAKRLKKLRQENTRLKRLLADAELDKAMLKELRLRGVLITGKHYRRWGCTQGRIHCSGNSRMWRAPSLAGVANISSQNTNILRERPKGMMLISINRALSEGREAPVQPRGGGEMP